MQGVIRAIWSLVWLSLSLLVVPGCTQRPPPAPPWATQLQAATQAAAALDPTAVFVGGVATPPYQSNRHTAPSFECTWEFISARDGTFIGVRFQDTDIAGTIETVTHDGAFAQAVYPYPLTEAEQQRLAAAQAAIHISPADVFRQATASGLPGTNPDDFVGVSLVLTPPVQEQLGIPAVWNALFLDANLARHVVWLDATTGTVLGQTDDQSTLPTSDSRPATATPTP